MPQSSLYNNAAGLLPLFVIVSDDTRAHIVTIHRKIPIGEANLHTTVDEKGTDQADDFQEMA